MAPGASHSSDASGARAISLLHFDETEGRTGRGDGFLHTGLVGAGAGKHNRFTIAARPAPRRVHDLPRFVDVKGGQYFFLPGIQALEFLAGGI